MAKGTTVKVIGEVRKLSNGKEWGVPVIYSFVDGTDYATFYTGKRKKDVVDDMNNGKLELNAKAAKLETTSDGKHWLRFSWVIDFAAGGMRPAEEGEC